jgi:hypothetical protein
MFHSEVEPESQYTRKRDASVFWYIGLPLQSSPVYLREPSK